MTIVLYYALFGFHAEISTSNLLVSRVLKIELIQRNNMYVTIT